MSQKKQPKKSNEAEAPPGSNLTDKERKLIKEKLVRSKLYRIAASLCGLAAFLISVLFYQVFAEGEPIQVVKNPILIAVLFFPFVPACFLAILSKRKRTQAIKLLKPHYKTMKASEVQRLKQKQ